MPLLSAAPRRRRALGFAALAAALLGSAASASAAPVTYTAASGASVTLSSDTFVAGERIDITGTGFTPSTGQPVGPYVAIKPNDVAATGWTYGGPNRVDEALAPEDDLPVFDAGADGAFSGWVQLPANFPKTGPGTGVRAGQHWLRILAGAFPANNPTAIPVTMQAFFSVVDRVTLGYTNTATTPVFFPGTVRPPTGSPATVKAIGFGNAKAVTITVDKATANLATTITAGGTTAADGQIDATVALPPALAAGDHTLTIETADRTEIKTFTVTAHAANVLTPKVRPGGTFAVSYSGFQAVGGVGQKIAIALGGDAVGSPLPCAQASAAGAGLSAFAVPSTATAGAKNVDLRAGTNCLGGTIQTDPLGRVAQVPSGLTIDPAAPQVTTTFVRASVGSGLPVSVVGFGAGEAITAKIDGTTIPGTLSAGGDGSVTGSVAIPAGTALGERVLVLSSATSAAALKFTAAAAPVATITSELPVTQGAALSFTLAGLVRGDGTAGQKIGVKIDAGDIFSCVTANASGDGEGTITVPADLAAGEHTLRFLTGTSCVSGGPQNDLPGRSIAVTFTVKAAPIVEQPKVEEPKVDPPVSTPPVLIIPAVDVQAPTKLKALKGGKAIELTIDAGEPKKVKVSVKSSSKVKLTKKGKAKIVTVAKVKTVTPKGGKTTTVKLTLTADGKALLKKLGKLKVTVTITPDGAGSATTRTFTLLK